MHEFILITELCLNSLIIPLQPWWALELHPGTSEVHLGLQEVDPASPEIHPDSREVVVVEAVVIPLGPLEVVVMEAVEVVERNVTIIVLVFGFFLSISVFRSSDVAENFQFFFDSADGAENPLFSLLSFVFLCSQVAISVSTESGPLHDMKSGSMVRLSL